MKRPRLIVVLDALVLASVLFGLYLAFTGGFVFLVEGLGRISARTPERPFLLAVVLLAIRLWRDRVTGPLGLSGSRWRSWAGRVLGSAADPLHPPIPGLRRRVGYVTLALLAMSAVVMYPQWRQPFAVPDLGDPLFNVWRTAWVAHQIVREPLRIFDANIYYPQPLTFTYSDSMLLPALTAAPLVWLGVHPLLATQLLFFSGFVLSGLAVYVLVERLTAVPLAAFIPAAIYTLYPYRFEHYSHLELQFMQWMPLGLLALHLAMSTGRGGYVLLLALAVVAQLYSSMYYAMFFAVYLAAVSLVLFVALRPPVRRLLPWGVGAGMLALLLAYPLVRAYNASEDARGERQLSVVESYSPVPLDYLRAHPRSVMWAERALPEPLPERALFPGVVPLALAAGGLFPPFGVGVATYAAGLLVAFDGSLGMNGSTYPWLYEWLSPFRNMRVPARFSALVGLSLCVLAGFGVRRLLNCWPTPAASVAIIATLTAAVMVDVWPRLELRQVWREPPRVYEALRGRSDVVLAEFPGPNHQDDLHLNTVYMYFSVWHWLPMVNGYSGNSPPSFPEYIRETRDFPDEQSVQALRAAGATHVTYNCALTERNCGRALEQIDASGAFRLVTEDIWQGRTVRLYELLR